MPCNWGCGKKAKADKLRRVALLRKQKKISQQDEAYMRELRRIRKERNG